MIKVDPSYITCLNEAKSFIEDHDHFLVVSHVQPDGDAASSTCAIGYLLHQLKKDFVMINEGNIPKKFSYMWGQQNVISFEQLQTDKKFKYVIAVDCADFSRIGDVRKCFDTDYELLNIDHHPTNDRYGHLNLIDEKAAATAEILHDLIEYSQYPLDKSLATCIYTGLLTDTGGFRYANTTPKVMNIASQLLSYGVDGHQMAEDLLEKLTMEHIHLLKRALTSLSFTDDQRISWIVVTEEDMRISKAANDDLEGLVNYPRNIEGVQVGMMFKQKDDQTVKVSFRSDGQVDVSLVAQFFEGGGHIRAAGATINATLHEAVEQVLDKLQLVMK